nr:NADH-quinone oxidoreductase subunit N [Penaeicola halotolerans]
MANNWLVFFLLMEFLSITGYIITSFNRDKSSYEGAIKYLLFGAAASAIMLYGISLIYGMTGSMSIGDLANGMELDSGLLSLGLLFVLLGIFFKIALFPMHVWLPSAYQGAPSSGIVLLSVAPKVAALLFLWHLTSIIELGKIGFDLLPMFQWQQMIGILAIITMLGANAAALWQTNVKRLLAWSSVGHGGFMLAGVLTLSAFGQSTLLFYASVYALMNMGAFLLVLLIKKRTQNEEDINAFRGLASLHPFLGVLVTLLMLSFIGLPPTGGFMAKFLLFSAIWDTYQQSGEPIYIWVFAAGLFSSVISLFYYMKIPYLMYFKPLNSKDPKLVSLKSLDYLMMFLIVVALMVLFFKANWLMNILNSLNFAL